MPTFESKIKRRNSKESFNKKEACDVSGKSTRTIEWYVKKLIQEWPSGLVNNSSGNNCKMTKVDELSICELKRKMSLGKQFICKLFSPLITEEEIFVSLDKFYLFHLY